MEKERSAGLFTSGPVGPRAGAASVLPRQHTAAPLPHPLQVLSVPEGATVLASSERCPIEM